MSTPEKSTGQRLYESYYAARKPTHRDPRAWSQLPPASQKFWQEVADDYDPPKAPEKASEAPPSEKAEPGALDESEKAS